MSPTQLQETSPCLKGEAVIRVGDKVRLAPAYQMGGKWAYDGHEGEWFCVGISQGGRDIYIGREVDGDWHGICHLSRVVGNPACTWRG